MPVVFIKPRYSNVVLPGFVLVIAFATLLWPFVYLDGLAWLVLHTVVAIGSLTTC